MAIANDPYAAFRYSNYRFFLAGAVLASLGMEVQAATIAWEVYNRTDSYLAVAYVSLAQFFPVLLFALPAGQIADRYSRKLIFQLAQCLQMVAGISLAAISAYQGPIEWIYSLLVLSGIARAFMAPARTALLPLLIPLEHLPNAVTWNSSGWQFANVMGPALGGLVLGFTHPYVCYLLAYTCAMSCVLLLIPLRPSAQARPTGSASGPVLSQGNPLGLRNRLRILLEGVRFVFRTQLLLAAITLDLFAVLLGGATALLSVYARDILQVDATGYGLLRAAPAAGAVAMAFFLAYSGSLRRPGQALLLSVAAFGVATIAFGLSTSFWLSLVLLALIGACDNVSVVVRGTLMQLLTPDSMRGRVSAVNIVFISSSNELGGFESGLVAWLIGPVLSVVGGGIGTLLVVLLAAWKWPQLLRLGPLHTLGAVEEAEEFSTGNDLPIPPPTPSGEPGQ